MKGIGWDLFGIRGSAIALDIAESGVPFMGVASQRRPGGLATGSTRAGTPDQTLLSNKTKVAQSQTKNGGHKCHNHWRQDFHPVYFGTISQ